MILIGLSGKRRSGKTFLADMLASEYGFTHLSLAQPLKKMCKQFFGLTEDHVNGTKKEASTQFGKTPRQIMIETGSFFRSIDPNFWINELAWKIPTQGACVISDIRFKNEADWIKERGGILVRLERAVELTGEPIDDPSECELDNYDGFSLRILESSNVDSLDMVRIAERVNSFVHGTVNK